MEKCIIYKNDDGSIQVSGVSPGCTLPIEVIAETFAPNGSPYKIVDLSEIPADSTFFDAFECDFDDTTSAAITINMDKAKTVGHVIRRAMRDEEFAPLDAVIMKQIPGTDTAAIEAQRQAIRDKYAGIQTHIDAAETPEAVKAALGME